MAITWAWLNLLEANELEYSKRRRLIDLELEKEDYEPAMTDIQFEGETCEEFYRREWFNESKE